MKVGVINLEVFYASQKDQHIFDSYKRINHICSLTDGEISAINTIYEELKKRKTDIEKLYGYFLGLHYKGIVSEQFDILRFSNEKIINIELKSKTIEENEMLRQLIRHQYFLSTINANLKVELFVFDEQTYKLYKLDNDSLVECSFEKLIEDIPKDYIEENLFSKIRESSFIKSPYSEPKDFYYKQYFLNTEQDKASKMLINSTHEIVVLGGGPGTGKSLVLFDVASKLAAKNLKVLFVFCSGMSESDKKNICEYLDFEFIPIKELKKVENLEKFNVIIIDECQRIKEDQYKFIKKLLKEKLCKKLILAIDEKQTLKIEEEKFRIRDRLIKDFNNRIEFVEDLVKLVRQSPEIQNFIKKFFGEKSINDDVIEYTKINVIHFNRKRDAQRFIHLSSIFEEYTVIEIPEYSGYRGCKGKNLSRFISWSPEDSFKVIGREYDKVILPIDKKFKYDKTGNLIIECEKNYPYIPENCLYQAITRTKNELLIVVVNNKDLFKKIEEILNGINNKKIRNNKNNLEFLRDCHNLTVDEISNKLKIDKEDYEKMESTGEISDAQKRKLRKFYKVENKYFEGILLKDNYNKVGLLYDYRMKSLKDTQKNNLEIELIKVLNSI